MSRGQRRAPLDDDADVEEAIDRKRERKKEKPTYLLEPFEDDGPPCSVHHAMLLVDLREPQRGDPGGDAPHAGLRRRRRIGVVVIDDVVSVCIRIRSFSPPSWAQEGEAPGLRVFVSHVGRSELAAAKERRRFSPSTAARERAKEEKSD